MLTYVAAWLMFAKLETMSDVDNNTTCDENYDEVDDGYTKAISALATREQQNDTDQILSSASQDFQYLDEVAFVSTEYITII